MLRVRAPVYCCLGRASPGLSLMEASSVFTDLRSPRPHPRAIWPPLRLRLTKGARELRAYAAEMNINERLIDDMLVVPPQNVRWLSAEDRQSYGLGFLDPVYEETAIIQGAQSYNITPSEYRRRDGLAKSVCRDCTPPDWAGFVPECYGILEAKRSQCAVNILAGGKVPP